MAACGCWEGLGLKLEMGHLTFPSLPVVSQCPEGAPPAFLMQGEASILPSFPASPPSPHSTPSPRQQLPSPEVTWL